MTFRAIRFILPCCLILVGMPPALAQQSLAPALGECLRIFGAVERLACYDRLARATMGGTVGSAPATSYAPPAPRYAPPATATFGLTPQAQAPQAYQPSAAVPPADQFGAERLPQAQTDPARLNRIASAITGFTQSPVTGKFTVTLANGQVWRESQGESTPIRYRRTSTRSAVISRGLIGSYNLKFNDYDGYYKVERVQ